MLGRRLESRLETGVAAAVLLSLALDPPTKRFVADCITIRPLLIIGPAVLPTACSRVCHSHKNPKCVFLSD